MNKSKAKMSLLIDTSKKSNAISSNRNKMGLITEPKSTKNAVNKNIEKLFTNNNYNIILTSNRNENKMSSIKYSQQSQSSVAQVVTRGSSNSIQSINSDRKGSFINSGLIGMNVRNKVSSHDRISKELRNNSNKAEGLSDILLNRSRDQDAKNTSNFNLGGSILNYSQNKINPNYSQNKINTPDTIGKRRGSRTASLVFDDGESKKFSFVMPGLGVNLGGGVEIKSNMFKSKHDTRKDSTGQSSFMNTENNFKLNETKNISPFYNQNLIKKRIEREDKSDNLPNDFRQTKIQVEKSHLTRDNDTNNINYIMNEANKYLDRIAFEKFDDNDVDFKANDKLTE